MKSKFKFLSVCAIGLCAMFGTAARAEVHFKDVSFVEAKKLAAKGHKKIMVDFFTTWCGWCKVLDKQTYSDESVGKMADAKFISIKLDAEKGEGRELAKQYQISGYPTIMFFTAEGKVVDKVVGYEDAPKFLRSLKNAAAGGTAGVLEEINGKKPCKDASKWIVAGDYYASKKDNVNALNAFQNVIKYDPENKQGLKQSATYGVAFLTEDPQQWQLLEDAVSQYPKAGDGQQAVMRLIQHYLDESNGENAERLMDRWAMQNPDDAQTFNFFAWQAAEKGVSLDAAERYAGRAIGLSKTPQDRATVLDTRAEILFKSNRATEALNTEEDALRLLDPTKDAKLHAELTKQKAKFAAANQAGGANAPAGVEGTTVTPQTDVATTPAH